MIWRDSIDPSTIPDQVLTSEWGRRRSARRRTIGWGKSTGRPKVLKICPRCKAQMGARELRAHKC